MNNNNNFNITNSQIEKNNTFSNFNFHPLNQQEIIPYNSYDTPKHNTNNISFNQLNNNMMNNNNIHQIKELPNISAAGIQCNKIFGPLKPLGQN